MTQPFTLTPGQIAEGWRPHNNSGCPFGNGVIHQYMRRNGQITGAMSHRFPREWFVRNQNPQLEIVAYRLYTPVLPDTVTMSRDDAEALCMSIDPCDCTVDAEGALGRVHHLLGMG